MKNYDVFEKFIDSKEVIMKKFRDEDNIYFKSEQRTDNGAAVVMITSFYDDSDVVEVEIYNLARLDNPLKEEKFLYLLNDLNKSTRFTKFILTESNDIKLFYAFLADKNFTNDSAQTVIDSMIMLLRSANEAYPKFMKLQWS